jgi:hypothetical protein
MITQLFQISLFHRYFTSGMLESCRIVPDADTRLFLQRYPLVLRGEPGKIGLYSDSKNTPSALLDYLQQRLAGAPLRFLLSGDESLFARITDLPFDFVGQIALSTKQLCAAVDDAGVPPSHELAPVPGPRQLNQPGVFGQVSVYLDDCLALGGQDVRYQVHFEARVLHWLYYVINRGENKLRQPVIRNQQKMIFDAPVQVLLDTGETALSFSSGAMQFPLQEAPETTFDLIDHLQPSLHTGEQTIEHCLIKGLPTPCGDNLKAKQVDGSLYTFGEMYVYL